MVSLSKLKIEDILEQHEGKRKFPYLDTVGKTTIGIGRNLTDVGLSEDEIQYLFQNDIKRVIRGLDNWLPWWREKSENVRIVLMSMCFNLGIEGLLKFKKFLAALRINKLDDAAVEMLDSKWAEQVGKRAIELSDMVRNG